LKIEIDGATLKPLLENSDIWKVSGDKLSWVSLTTSVISNNIIAIGMTARVYKKLEIEAGKEVVLDAIADEENYILQITRFFYNRAQNVKKKYKKPLKWAKKSKK